MTRDTNLTRRGAVYQARIYVPKDLHAALGKTEIRPSLRTTDYAEAKRRKAAVVDQWTAIFDDMRRRRDLTADDIRTAVWGHYSAGLEANDKERLTRPTVAEIDAAEDKAIAESIRSGAAFAGQAARINAMTEVEIFAGHHEWAARRRTSRLNRLRSDLAAGDTRLIEPDVDAFLAKHGFTVERGGERYRELCAAMTRGEIEQLRRTAERDKGDFTGKPADPIVAEPVRPLDLSTENGGTIMSLFGKYEKEKAPNTKSR